MGGVFNAAYSTFPFLCIAMLVVVHEATHDADIEKCWAVIHELRPHLEHAAFVPQVHEMLREGYHLAYIEIAGQAVAAIGYRRLQYLVHGKHIYIDDLSTLPDHRGNGYAQALLEYVEAQARANRYSCVTLDSGHQRHTAHRLYLNQGFVMIGHHFKKAID